MRRRTNLKRRARRILKRSRSGAEVERSLSYFLIPELRAFRAFKENK